MKKLLLTIALSYSLLAEFKTITADSLIKMQKQGIPVIDIRTPQEWKDRGIIKGAHKIMFFTPQGGADVPNFMFELGHLVKDKKQPFIIYFQENVKRVSPIFKGTLLCTLYFIL